MTIKDIARESGYGVGTVSRVLNNQESVSQQARERILSVVDKYGFVLNQNAKQLKEIERKTIIILVKGASNMLFNSFLEVIQNRIENLPYNLSVVILDESGNEAKKACEIYYARNPAGMIFLGGTPDIYKDDFARIQIPCVIISNLAHDVENKKISSISIDDVKGSEVLTEYLIENGHKKIGVIGGELKTSELSIRRFNSFLEVMKKHNLEFDFEKQYEVSKYSIEGGYNAVSELLKKFPEMTAVFTMSDAMAIGAIRGLADNQKKVPDDISVTGFDGLKITDFYVPRITTIRQVSKDLALQGLDLLITNIESPKTEELSQVHKLISFDFVQGESVKKIN